MNPTTRQQVGEAVMRRVELYDPEAPVRNEPHAGNRRPRNETQPQTPPRRRNITRRSRSARRARRASRVSRKN